MPQRAAGKPEPLSTGIRSRELPARSGEGVYFRVEVPAKVAGRRLLKQFRSLDEAEEYAAQMALQRKRQTPATGTRSLRFLKKRSGSVGKNISASNGRPATAKRSTPALWSVKRPSKRMWRNIEHKFGISNNGSTVRRARNLV